QHLIEINDNENCLLMIYIFKPSFHYHVKEKILVSSDILCELLEVSINLILYTREVYPSRIFRRRKKYNIPVQMCVYPELSNYISDCIGSVKPILEKGEIEKLIIALLSKDRVVEKFVFDIKQEPVRPFDVKYGINTTFSIQIQVPEDYKQDVDMVMYFKHFLGLL
ncbi:Mitotic spindle assembly checkpoint protein MAD2B, partial [Armadillidium nasatum]